ncbi:unnamed protein product [Penicillium pancosmium]
MSDIQLDFPVTPSSFIATGWHRFPLYHGAELDVVPTFASPVFMDALFGDMICFLEAKARDGGVEAVASLRSSTWEHLDQDRTFPSRRARLDLYLGTVDAVSLKLQVLYGFYRDDTHNLPLSSAREVPITALEVTREIITLCIFRFGRKLPFSASFDAENGVVGPEVFCHDRGRQSRTHRLMQAPPTQGAQASQ